MKPARDFWVKLSTGWTYYLVERVRGFTAWGQTVRIDPAPESRDRLDSFCHETLHASKPSLSEAEVVRLAGDLAAVLWRAGYRRSR